MARRVERYEVRLHASRVVYHRAGSGPTLLMIHGLAQESSTWELLNEYLGEHADLICPDLPGHGDSEPPQGDHSLGAFASTMRDLLLALDRRRATIVGHSLGGGVALQFAYQFPEMVDRLILIDSGGLGRDLSPMLRAATLPGADTVLSVASKGGVNGVLRRGAQLIQKVGRKPGGETDVDLTLESIHRLGNDSARRSFLRTVQAVIELSGQAVSAQGKLYLLAHIPTLIVWGSDDHIIPFRHGLAAHEAMPGSHLRVVSGGGHFPHVDAPEAVADAIASFLEVTTPAQLRSEDIGRLIRAAEEAEKEAAEAADDDQGIAVPDVVHAVERSADSA